MQSALLKENILFIKKISVALLFVVLPTTPWHSTALTANYQPSTTATKRGDQHRRDDQQRRATNNHQPSTFSPNKNPTKHY